MGSGIGAFLIFPPFPFRLPRRYVVRTVSVLCLSVRDPSSVIRLAVPLVSAASPSHVVVSVVVRCRSSLEWSGVDPELGLHRLSSLRWYHRWCCHMDCGRPRTLYLSLPVHLSGFIVHNVRCAR